MKSLDRLDVNFPLDVNKELRSTKDNLFNLQRPQEKRASYCSLKLGCSPMVFLTCISF